MKLLKPLFSKTGLEPTFYPEFTILPWMCEGNRDDNHWERISNQHISSFVSWLGQINTRRDVIAKECSGPVAKWLRRADRDDRSLEVCTPDEYDNFAHLLRDYQQLTYFLKKRGFYPHSQLCMDTEGGCHLNFDLESVFTTKKQDGFHHRWGTNWNFEKIPRYQYTVKPEYGTFCRNLLMLYNQYPTLAWLCLAPNDNGSAKILFNTQTCSTCKGMVVNFRSMQSYKGKTFYNYVEMRAFMQPRTITEFVFHYNVANNILHHCKQLAEAGTTLKKRFMGIRQMQQYFDSYDKVVENANAGLQAIGIPAAAAQKVGKFALLQQRWEYHTAKHLNETYLT